MITSKKLDRVIAFCMAVVMAAIFVLMISPAARKAAATGLTFPYASVLSRGDVLELSIQIDETEWQDMLSTPLEEEYTVCSITLDGTTVNNVGIRTKGNTSLSQVASTDSDRFSFKLEFDHYVSGQTWLGLDKLCLNNNVYDATLMKEYLTYNWMQQLGVDTPLCSYIKVSVNGEYWGLYLGVEAIEESFAERCYGTDYGNLYKPETMEMGGGMEQPDFPAGDGGEMPELPADEGGTRQTPDYPTGDGGEIQERGFGGDKKGFGGFGGGQDNGADLVYTDDNPESYSALFESAVFDITEEDEQRLIAALKELNEGTNPLSVVDMEKTLAYFAVSVFTVNLDSYLSSMTHNYYLYEKDGILTMLPWDFNLSFAGFQSGDASSAVNYPIDTALSGVSEEQRPILTRLLNTESGLAYYHACLEKLAQKAMDGTFSQQVAALYQQIKELAGSDPTAFYSAEEVETAVSELDTFIQLRGQSVMGQLEGTVPATEQEQQEYPERLIDASSLDLQAMGMQGGNRDNRNEGKLGFTAAGQQQEAAFQLETESSEESKTENNDFSDLHDAMRVIGNTDLSELSEEQIQELEELGIDADKLAQIQQKDNPAGSRIDGGMMESTHTWLSDGTILCAAGTVVMLAAMAFVLFYRRYRLRRYKRK